MKENEDLLIFSWLLMEVMMVLPIGSVFIEKNLPTHPW